MRGLFGIAATLLLAWVLSEDRFRVAWRVVAAGVLLQFGLALLFLKFPPAAAVFLLLNHAVEALQKATEAGTGFVFGYLGGAELPFAETKPGSSFIFAFRALPMVLVVSALATLLFYWGVLQRIVQAFAWVLRHTVGIGGPLGLGAAVHIFVGHIEAPLLIRPYLLRMSRGELFALMSCGMAGIAGTVMVLYASLLGRVIPDALGNILMAAVISTPAALAADALSDRARLIMTYALCGFANFGSLGILIGGMGAMVPERRPEIVSLGLRSILSGTLATCMSGAVVGLL